VHVRENEYMVTGKGVCRMSMITGYKRGKYRENLKGVNRDMDL